MYIAVCDDQAEELAALAGLLERWQAERGHPVRTRTFQSAADLLDAAQRETFTLYLLDVMMPGIDGMEAAREIRSFDRTAELVFLTSSPGFAYESYGVDALEYLLKPIGAKLLWPILDRLYLREQRPQDGLTLKAGNTLVRVPFSQLAYVEVNRKRLYFNLTDGQVREVAGSLNEYEDQLLSRAEFTRIHRSYIVNMLQIEELSPAGVRTFSGKDLPVSRLLFPQLQKDYMALLFSDREEVDG
ncbi:LytTR family DNA-binding domain-containing protein [Pseudoflavonifractor sp. MSJ-37]|uniref:LytR/AlgR family response regulator transcription factor n=1 Tax=Pseudoflavonifractor sp. MSJ-37 TaxID=2841531 RepID=UPI001C0FE637|nr:LytTR family DNA-binding domain-containing protein [Pseudoflavonifractor sp. MSJ-37]MBU5435523.1 LytTR family DNA-binding domain-containing protein [Pseudoflavonifractor sp. MSJ-37]